MKVNIKVGIYIHSYGLQSCLLYHTFWHKDCHFTLKSMIINLLILCYQMIKKENFKIGIGIAKKIRETGRDRCLVM